MCNIKDKFVEMCYVVSKDIGEYTFWWDYMERFNGDKDYSILKNKMENLLSLLNKDETILEKDIQNELWEII